MTFLSKPSEAISSPPGSRPPRRTSPASFFNLRIFSLFLLGLLCVPSSAASLERRNLIAGCAPSYDPAQDYFPSKAPTELSHAEDFEISYHLNYKLVRNERVKEVYALYQCGTPAPEPASLPAGTKILPVPLTSVAITSTLEIAFLDMLGLNPKIKYVQGPEYVSSACLQARVVSGEVKALSSNKTVQAEQLAEVDAVFAYSADASNNRSVAVSTALDPGDLHRAEWIFFIASFFNAEERALAAFNGVRERYACVSQLAKALPASPKVAFVDYKSYQTNKYAISTAAYKLDYIMSLGATPVHPSVSEFAQVSEWHAAMADVDIVIDETYLGDRATFLSNFELTPTSNFKFIQKGQIWREDRLQSELGALDWFEGAVPNPDTVLQDLLTIVKPEAGFEHQRIWFRNSWDAEPAYVDRYTSCADPAVATTTRSDECANGAASLGASALLVMASLALLVFWI